MECSRCITIARGQHQRPAAASPRILFANQNGEEALSVQIQCLSLLLSSRSESGGFCNPPVGRSVDVLHDPRQQLRAGAGAGLICDLIDHVLRTKPQQPSK